MSRKINLGRFLNVEITMAMSSFVTMAIVFVVATLAASTLLSQEIGAAIIFGVGVVFIHWWGDFLHQVGHILAASRLKYPAYRLHFWGPLSTTMYPKDEPELLPTMHVKRALGGPIASIIVSFVYGLILYVVGEGYEPINWLALFGVVESILVFTLGALTPMNPFMPDSMKDFKTDGDIVLDWFQARRAEGDQAA